MANPHAHSSSHGNGHGAGHGHGGGHDHALGETNDMNLKKIIMVGVVSLAIFAVGIAWAYKLKVDRTAEISSRQAPHTPTEIGKPEIGIVDQVPFDIDRRLDAWRADHKQRLESYGWVDRKKGIAHIPIEAAMDRVVAAPPDIAGEGVPPAAAPLVVPVPEPPKTTAPGQRMPEGARAR